MQNVMLDPERVMPNLVLNLIQGMVQGDKIIILQPPDSDDKAIGGGAMTA